MPGSEMKIYINLNAVYIKLIYEIIWDYFCWEHRN